MLEPLAFACIFAKFFSPPYVFPKRVLSVHRRRRVHVKCETMIQDDTNALAHYRYYKGIVN